jgi:hypothetical protein
MSKRRLDALSAHKKTKERGPPPLRARAPTLHTLPRPWVSVRPSGPCSPGASGAWSAATPSKSWQAATRARRVSSHVSFATRAALPSWWRDATWCVGAVEPYVRAGRLRTGQEAVAPARLRPFCFVRIAHRRCALSLSTLPSHTRVNSPRSTSSGRKTTLAVSSRSRCVMQKKGLRGCVCKRARAHVPASATPPANLATLLLLHLSSLPPSSSPHSP